MDIATYVYVLHAMPLFTNLPIDRHIQLVPAYIAVMWLLEIT